MATSLRRRVFEILDASDPHDRVGSLFGAFIVALIAMNVVAFILETVDAVFVSFSRAFLLFEWFSVAVFTVEYALRLWSAPEDPRFRGVLLGRARFAVTPLALVDVLAILPTYLALLPVAQVADMRFVRVLRFFRFLRLLKVGRYSESLKTLGNVLRAKREELHLSIIVVAVLLVLSSSLMYYAEHEAQPETFSSIPATMWWSIVTLTTIGYGDIYPVTSMGKALGGLTALLGIGMVALPTAVLATGFLDEIDKRHAGPKLCPHCGRDVDEAHFASESPLARR